MKYFLFTFLAYCSVISIGSAKELNPVADLLCILTTRYQNATPALKPIKISGFDCRLKCNRIDISADLSMQCDVGKSPKTKQLVDVSMALANILVRFLYNLDCEPEIHIDVNAANDKNIVEIIGVC